MRRSKRVFRSPVCGKRSSTWMQTRHPEPWPPHELCLPNLDALEALSRGEEPQPELASPSDTRTEARCLLPLLAIERRALFNTREVNYAF